jgi:hypothetical protein
MGTHLGLIPRGLDVVSALSELDDLLTRAREADPGDRINLRDPIAAHGELAIEAMTDWLGDSRLAAFAIRVLERVGREPALRPDVVDVLVSVDRTELPEHLIGDLDRALTSLDVPTRPSARRRSPTGQAARDRPKGTPGVRGRGYWAMRTSPWERPYIWAQAKEGRLRQGWGWAAEQDLDVIDEAVDSGHPLSEEQQVARRSRRMLSSEADGMQVGDLILAPNIPEWGQLCIFGLTGPYEYAPDTPRRFGDAFGHILPVELLAGPFDRRGRSVTDALRYTLGNPSRLWSIRPYGGDVERLATMGPQ